MNYSLIISFLLAIVSLATILNAAPLDEKVEAVQGQQQQQQTNNRNQSGNGNSGEAIRNHLNDFGKRLQQLPRLDKLPEYVIAKLAPF